MRTSLVRVLNTAMVEIVLVADLTARQLSRKDNRLVGAPTSIVQFDWTQNEEQVSGKAGAKTLLRVYFFCEGENETFRFHSIHNRIKEHFP